jgi:hypothetical protein
VRATRHAFGVAVLVETGLARASLPRRFLVDNPCGGSVDASHRGVRWCQVESATMRPTPAELPS